MRWAKYAAVTIAAMLLFGSVSGLIGAAIAIAVWEAGTAMWQQCHISRRDRG